MMHILGSSSKIPVQLDDFCRLCLLRKPDLRPLSSQNQTMMVSEMIIKVTGALLNMHDQLPRVICGRCLVKLELAYNICEEFRKQEQLLRRFSWKGALVDQLTEYQQSEESRRKPYSEEVIERLTVVNNTVSLEEVQERREDLPETVEIKQEVVPFDDQFDIIKPEPFEATEYSIQELPDDYTEEDVKQPEWKQQPKEIIDNGLEMVLELEDLRTIGALPDELLKQVDIQQNRRTNPKKRPFDGHFIPSPAESDEEQSDDEKDTDYVPYDDDQDGLESFAESDPENEEGLFRCEICNKRYDTKDESEAHRLARHKINQKPFKFECKYCQQRFERKNQKERHERSHKNQFEEKDSDPNLDPHKCPICYKRYSSVQIFNDHMLRHKNIKAGRFRCKLCYYSFGKLAELRQHEERHERNFEWRMTRDNIPPPIIINQDNKTTYKCDECQHLSNDYFKYVQHAQRHVIRKTGMFQCQECGNRYVMKKFLWQHQRKVHNLVIKPDPDDKETNVSSKPAPTVEIDKRLPHCSACDAFFMSQTDYQIHMKVHGTGSNRKTSDNETTEEGGQQMEASISKEPLVVLPSTSKELNKSMTLGYVWKCDECGKSVTIRTDGTYQSHKRRHEMIRKVAHKCEAFSNYTELNKHRVTTHGLASLKESNGTVECPQCKQQISKVKFKKHTETHENLTLRKFVCVKCNTALASQHYLTLHVKSGICDKPGYVPSSVEASSMEGLSELFTWDESERTPTGAKSQNIQFKCKQCNQLLNGYPNAAKHARRHGIMEAGVYTCEICKKVFPSKINLDRHNARNSSLGKICQKPKNLSAGQKKNQLSAE